MTNQHPITPPPELVQQWLAEPEYVSGWSGKCMLISITDHRLSNIAAKAAQWGADQEMEARQQKIRSGPESPLVERVADAIAAQATSAGIVNDRPARAAILVVAAWLREKGYGSWVTLEQEANRWLTTPAPSSPAGAHPPTLLTRRTTTDGGALRMGAARFQW